MAGNAIEVLKRTASNRYSRWSFQDASRNENPDLAINRLSKGSFVFSSSPKFTINPTDKVFTIGSCFAREIESALVKKNMNVLTRLSGIEGSLLFQLRPGVTSIHDFFNRYNLASMCHEMESLCGISPLISSDELIYEAGGEVYDDLHYTPAAVSASNEVLVARRKYLHEQLSGAIMDADVVIITLGLCEAWYDIRHGKYLNVVSSPQMLRKNGEYLELRTLGFAENDKFLGRIIDALQRIGRKKIICTVSPVPLEVTFSGKDIVLANHAAKSTLRVVAEEACKKYEHVDYFPSYEIAMFSEPAAVWKTDGRHIHAALIDYITTAALSLYLGQ